MAKPSIFSSNYRQEVKRKRNRRIALIIIIILIVTGGGLFIIKKSDIKSMIQSFKSHKSEVKESNESPKEASKDEKSEEKEEVADEKEENKKVDVTLPSNEQITLEIDKDNKILSIESNNSNLESILNNSSDKAVLYDTNEQTMALVDNTGNVTDITYKQYKSTKGSITTREGMLSSDSDFNWTRDPKFAGDNIIIYTSSVPWFKDELYLWKYDIATGEHNTLSVQGSSLFGGKNVSIDEYVEGKGLKVTVNNVTYYVDDTGKVSGE
ncbi:putative membrane protein [Clostridium bornimense]|uniref:Putative membrane protein n=1 Tax=Clostridium bornimense TaxID=1216932 RepID=W6S0D3_9CLOT|nr:hypothetical protein [Clostridium bornimense]CDM69319.1 putative membrane protein [Clostridium bornimense]